MKIATISLMLFALVAALYVMVHRPASITGAAQGEVSTAAELSAAETVNRAASSPAPPLAAAVDTSPVLTLTEVLSGPDASPIAAVIAHDGARARAYRVGDAIDGSPGVHLHSIFQDLAVVDRHGQLETLLLASGVLGDTVYRIDAPPLDAAVSTEQPSVRLSAPTSPPSTPGYDPTVVRLSGSEGPDRSRQQEATTAPTETGDIVRVGQPQE